jgi:hypothetical protein
MKNYFILIRKIKKEIIWLAEAEGGLAEQEIVQRLMRKHELKDQQFHPYWHMKIQGMCEKLAENQEIKRFEVTPEGSRKSFWWYLGKDESLPKWYLELIGELDWGL